MRAAFLLILFSLGLFTPHHLSTIHAKKSWKFWKRNKKESQESSGKKSQKSWKFWKKKKKSSESSESSKSNNGEEHETKSTKKRSWKFWKKKSKPESAESPEPQQEQNEQENTEIRPDEQYNKKETIAAGLKLYTKLVDEWDNLFTPSEENAAHKKEFEAIRDQFHLVLNPAKQAGEYTEREQEISTEIAEYSLVKSTPETFADNASKMRDKIVEGEMFNDPRKVVLENIYLQKELLQAMHLEKPFVIELNQILDPSQRERALRAGTRLYAELFKQAEAGKLFRHEPQPGEDAEIVEEIHAALQVMHQIADYFKQAESGKLSGGAAAVGADGIPLVPPANFNQEEREVFQKLILARTSISNGSNEKKYAHYPILRALRGVEDGFSRLKDMIDGGFRGDDKKTIARQPVLIKLFIRIVQMPPQIAHNIIGIKRPENKQKVFDSLYKKTLNRIEEVMDLTLVHADKLGITNAHLDGLANQVLSDIQTLKEQFARAAPLSSSEKKLLDFITKTCTAIKNNRQPSADIAQLLKKISQKKNREMIGDNPQMYDLLFGVKNGLVYIIIPEILEANPAPNGPTLDQIKNLLLEFNNKKKRHPQQYGFAYARPVDGVKRVAVQIYNVFQQASTMRRALQQELGLSPRDEPIYYRVQELGEQLKHVDQFYKGARALRKLFKGKLKTINTVAPIRTLFITVVTIPDSMVNKLSAVTDKKALKEGQELLEDIIEAIGEQKLRPDDQQVTATLAEVKARFSRAIPMGKTELKIYNYLRNIDRDLTQQRITGALVALYKMINSSSERAIIGDSPQIRELLFSRERGLIFNGLENALENLTLDAPGYSAVEKLIGLLQKYPVDYGYTTKRFVTDQLSTLKQKVNDARARASREADERAREQEDERNLDQQMAASRSQSRSSRRESRRQYQHRGGYNEGGTRYNAGNRGSSEYDSHRQSGRRSDGHQRERRFNREHPEKSYNPRYQHDQSPSQGRYSRAPKQSRWARVKNKMWGRKKSPRKYNANTRMGERGRESGWHERERPQYNTRQTESFGGQQRWSRARNSVRSSNSFHKAPHRQTSRAGQYSRRPRYQEY